MRVTQEWMDNCSMKEQTVMLTALRGCDLTDKNDLSKLLIRKLRSVLLKDAGHPDRDMTDDFMQDRVNWEIVRGFTGSLDRYPLHFVMHLMHASEIVGYKHPDDTIRAWWHVFYRKIVEALHLNVETEYYMDSRLSDGGGL